MEVFSIDEVSSIDADTRQVVTYRPFYSYRQETTGTRNECYWIANRRSSNRLNDDASDLYISLVDRSGRTAVPRHRHADGAHHLHQPEPARAPALWQ